MVKPDCECLPEGAKDESPKTVNQSTPVSWESGKEDQESWWSSSIVASDEASSLAIQDLELKPAQ